MNHVDYFQNSDNSGYHVDTDFSHIVGNWESPEALRKSLSRIFKKYDRVSGYPPLLDASTLSYHGKDIIRIFICAPSDSIDIDMDEHNLKFSFAEKLNGDWYKFRLAFYEISGIVAFHFDATHSVSPFFHSSRDNEEAI